MFNKTILVGRLGKDPDMKYTPTGKAVTTFSLATDSGFGEKKKTEWHNIVTWEKTAEACNQYLTKGSLVLVEGRTQSRSWDKDDGTKGYMTEVVAETVRFLEKKEDNGKGSKPAAQPAPAAASVSGDDFPF